MARTLYAALIVRRGEGNTDSRGCDGFQRNWSGHELSDSILARRANESDIPVLPSHTSSALLAKALAQDVEAPAGLA